MKNCFDCRWIYYCVFQLGMKLVFVDKRQQNIVDVCFFYSEKDDISIEESREFKD
jgi:hypothetical protein